MTYGSDLLSKYTDFDNEDRIHSGFVLAIGFIRIGVLLDNTYLIYSFNAKRPLTLEEQEAMLEVESRKVVSWFLSLLLVKDNSVNLDSSYLYDLQYRKLEMNLRFLEI